MLEDLAAYYRLPLNTLEDGRNMVAWRKYEPYLLTRLTQATISRLHEETKSTYVEAGIHSDASDQVKAAAIAAEYGNARSNVPPRYLFSKAIAASASDFKKPLQKLTRIMLLRACGRKLSTLGPANQMAKLATKALRETLLSFLPPPLSEGRLAQKMKAGYTKPDMPFYATGELHQALSGRVVTK